MVRKFKKTKKKSMKGGVFFDAMSYANTRDPKTQTTFEEGSPLYTPKPKKKPPSPQYEEPNVIQMDPIHISEDAESESTPKPKSKSPPISPPGHPENAVTRMKPFSLEPPKLEDGQILTDTVELSIGVKITLTVKLHDFITPLVACLADVYIMVDWSEVPRYVPINFQNKYDNLKEDKDFREWIDRFNKPDSKNFFKRVYLNNTEFFKRILYDFSGEYPKFCLKNFMIVFNGDNLIFNPVDALRHIYMGLASSDKIETDIEMRTGKWMQTKKGSKKQVERNCPLDPCIQIYLELETGLPYPFKKIDKTFILHPTEAKDDMEIIEQFTKIEKKIASTKIQAITRRNLVRDKYYKSLIAENFAFGQTKKKHNKRKHKKKKKTKHKKKKHTKKKKKKSKSSQ